MVCTIARDVTAAGCNDDLPGRQGPGGSLQDSQSVSAYESFELPKVPVPFYSGNPWFLPIIGNYHRYLDSRERRRAGL